MRRRAISVRGSTYERAKAHCDAEGMTVSGFLEELIAEKLPEPYASGEYAEPPRKSTGPKPKDPDDPDDSIGGVRFF